MKYKGLNSHPEAWCCWLWSITVAVLCKLPMQLTFAHFLCGGPQLIVMLFGGMPHGVHCCQSVQLTYAQFIIA